MKSFENFLKESLNEAWEAWDSEIPGQLRDCDKFINSPQFKKWLIEQAGDEDMVDEIFDDTVKAFTHLVQCIRDIIDETTARSATAFWKDVQNNYYDWPWWDSCPTDDEQACSVAASSFPEMFKKATGKKVKLSFDY